MNNILSVPNVPRHTRFAGPATPQWRRLTRYLALPVTLVVVGTAHAYNMFRFPFYNNDEGTYMSQAWAVIKEHRLAPYTYWYDHAPLGWLQLAAWAFLTGGFHTFGDAIESGRVFMLLLQLASSLVLYRIAVALTGKMWPGLLAVLMFGLSAYGIYYHRRVLLDNIMTFWMLLSILALVRGGLTLRKVWLSAGALGISILSKELTVFLIPPLMALVASRTSGSIRILAVTSWLMLTLSIVSLYVLLAILKGELFPPDSWLGGSKRHVSLLCTLSYQASRGHDGGILSYHSQFWTEAVAWARSEPVLVIGGTVSVFLCLLLIRRFTPIALVALSSLFLWTFLGRGGETLDFYLVPILPLLSLNLSMSLWCVSVIRKQAAFAVALRTAGMPACLLLLLASYPYGGFNHHDSPDRLLAFDNHEAAATPAAITWIRTNVSASSRVVIDDSMWTDLQDPGAGEPHYRQAQWFYKVELDPEIRDGVFHGNWRNIDYIVSTPELEYRGPGFPLIDEALAHSVPVAAFETGGAPIQVLKVEPAATAPRDMPANNQRAPVVEGGRTGNSCGSSSG